MELEVNRELVVSTGHITSEENDLLSIACNDDRFGILIDEYEEGYRIWTGTPNEHIDNFPTEDGKPNGLANVKLLVILARATDCKWLVLDRDGPTIDGFKQFDW
ncbi:MAG: hypothetical protein JRC53_01135 [Deltaproteobacteria bacterium]|nr:hypothetical protein [Deltaproteobacteria bacterium]